MDNTREVVLEIETTGINLESDRIVEIAIVELVNRQRTGKNFHAYFSVDIPMSESAYSIHGISQEYICNKPKIEELFPAIQQFIGDDPIIAHYAHFDIAMLNKEASRAKYPAFTNFTKDIYHMVKTMLKVYKTRSPEQSKLQEQRHEYKALHDANLVSEVYHHLFLNYGNYEEITEFMNNNTDYAKALLDI